MLYALNLDDKNRILSVTYDKYAPIEQPRTNMLPNGNVCDYIFENGEYMYDPLPTEEVVEQATQLDIIEAQIMYTAMCTDTLLTEV